MAVLWVLAVAVIVAGGVGLYQLFARYRRELEENRRVRALFSRYVPPQVVDELLDRNDPRLFEAQEYHATILCCRIRNFPLFAEELTAQETLRYLNEFYAIAGRAIERHRGMIESLRSDGINAVFGVLIDSPFQEERALRAALDIVRLVNGMNARWQAQGRRPFAVTVGLNSGRIVAGDVGFQRRREFAVIGNPAHIAARLQQAAEELNAYILASATTYEPVAELFSGVPASMLPLRGLKRLQRAYIVRGLAKRDDDHLLRLPREDAIAHTVVRSEPPETVERGEYVAPEEPAEEHFYPTADDFAESSVGPQISIFDDTVPAMPEPPVVTGTYEDSNGPPFQLPP